LQGVVVDTLVVISRIIIGLGVGVIEFTGIGVATSVVGADDSDDVAVVAFDVQLVELARHRTQR